MAGSGFPGPSTRRFAVRKLFNLLLPFCLFSTSTARWLPNVGRHLNQGQPDSLIYQGSLSCGFTFSCGIKSDGAAWCWGVDNPSGQLGNNSPSGSTTPVPVTSNSTWLQISAGNATTCGIQSDRSAWCWGSNASGQCGISPGSDWKPVARIPTAVYTGFSPGDNSTWVILALGANHACGIMDGGTLWCWGSSDVGALGNGELQSTRLVPQQIGGATDWLTVASGVDFSCAIKTNGTLCCWGNNIFGQCGREAEETDQILVPTPVARAGTSVWAALYIGSGSSSVFAVQNDSTVWVWGDGRGGQLAVGSFDIIYKPQQVLSGFQWKGFAPAQGRTFGVLSNGTAVAWGSALDGQLGAGSGLNVSLGPVAVVNPGTTDTTIGAWSAMCGHLTQSCGIFQDDMFCWGSEAGGTLGSPGGDAYEPRIVRGGGTWGVLGPTPGPGPFLGPPPGPTAPPPPPPPAGSGSNAAAIVGGVVGGFVGLAVVGSIAYIVWRRKRRLRRPVPGALSKYLKFNGSGSGSRRGTSAALTTKQDAVLCWADKRPSSAIQPQTSMDDIPSQLAPLMFDWSDVEVLKPLGSGSFGQVFLATIRHAKVAVKVLVDADAVLAAETASKATGTSSSLASVPHAHIGKLIQEATLMASLQHPNVVHLLGFCLAPPCMAVEYCTRGSLFDLLCQAASEPVAAKRLTWQRRLKMAKEGAAGVLHLHTRTPPIFHRDIKSPNFLVTTDLTVKVSDMGLSKLAEDAAGGTISTAGGASNPRWLAPEVMQGEKGMEKSDVYSFGVVLWEILTWQLPWGDLNIWAICSSVLQGGRPEVPPLDQLPGFEEPLTAVQEENISDYINLMQRCMQPEPSDRPDFSEIATELSRLMTSWTP